MMMNYNLDDIRTELVNNIKDAFDKSSNPTYSSLDIDFASGLELFFKTVIYKCGVQELDGLTKTILPTLHEAYISRKGELAPLKILSAELEAYLKKIAFIVSGGTDNMTNDKSKSLISLFNHLSLHSTQLYSTTLTEANLLSFRGSPEFIEFLCRSYIVRNTVHNSPNWKLSEIAINLESILVVYLYSTFKFKSRLSPIVGSIVLPNISLSKAPTGIEDSKKQALYDFITYNSGTTQVRKQIVTSFILHLLSRNADNVSLSSLRELCNKHFNTSADLQFYKEIVTELAKPSINKITITGVLDDQLSLTESEKSRIAKLKQDISYQEQLFELEITEVLKVYKIQDKVKDVIHLMTKLYEMNYDIDVKEILDEGGSAKDNIQNLQECLERLRSLSPKGGTAEKLLRELLIVTSGNDYLIKVSAGQVFANVSNLPSFNTYINQHVRIVYLDTNVLLHAICYYYEDDSEVDNGFYQSSRNLLKYVETHNNIELKTTYKYTEEVAFQLKEALLLVPFEDIGLFESTNGSNNVFYRFYKELKALNHLDDYVNSFADFLDGLDLREEDLDEPRFMSNTCDVIQEKLSKVNISVVDLSQYHIKTEALEIVKNSITLSGKFKDTVPMENDTYMVSFLSDKNSHDNEPTFVTWDTTFYDIRRKFVSKVKNTRMWHLFTPDKFLTHTQLLEFKIDNSNVTNDFLTLIDAIDFPERTRKILDSVSQLLDIQKEERRRYVSKLKEFSEVYIFNLNDQGQGENTDKSRDAKPIEKVISELFNYYSGKNGSKYKFSDLKLIFREKSLFDQIMNIIQKALESYVANRTFPTTMCEDFDKLISETNAKK